MKTVSVVLLFVLAVTLAASMPDQYPKISRDPRPVDKAGNNLGATIEQDIHDIEITSANLADAGTALAAGIVECTKNPVAGATQILIAVGPIPGDVLRLTIDIIDVGHQVLPPNCSTTTTNDATETPTCSFYRDLQGIYVNAEDLLTLGGGLTKAITDILHLHFKQAVQDVINIGNAMVQDIERISSYCFDIGHKILPPGSEEDVLKNLANARNQLQQQIEKVKQAGKQPLPDFSKVKLDVEDEQKIKQGLDQMEKQFAQAKQEFLKLTSKMQRK